MSEPQAYMLQVRRRGRWHDWWDGTVSLEQLRQAGGFNGLVAVLRESVRPFKGRVRLVGYHPEVVWVQGEVVAERGKARRGKHA